MIVIFRGLTHIFFHIQTSVRCYTCTEFFFIFSRTFLTVTFPCIHSNVCIFDYFLHILGIVRETTPMGGDLLLRIEFEKVGEKLMMAKTAGKFMQKV